MNAARLLQDELDDLHDEPGTRVRVRAVPTLPNGAFVIVKDVDGDDTVTVTVSLEHGVEAALLAVSIAATGFVRDAERCNALAS